MSRESFDTDKHASYSKAFAASVKEVRAAQCFRAFHITERSLEDIEALHMMTKGQVKRLAGSECTRAVKVCRESVRDCYLNE